MTEQKAIEIKEELLEEAARWHVRISSDSAGENVWLSFTDWLEEDALHRQAYDRIEDMVIDLEDAAGPLQEAFANTKQDSPLAGAQPPDHELPGGIDSVDNGGSVIQAAWRWQKQKVLAGVIAAAAAVMLVIGNSGVFVTPDVSMETYLTAIGEQQLVHLKDGSTIHLNTGSKLEVTLSAAERHTRLLYGEALFSVSKDKDRPFYVTTGDQQVRVVGTKFNVLRHAGMVTVTVVEGIVDVAPKPGVILAKKTKTNRLTVGKQSVHEEGTSESQLHDVDATSISMWGEGLLAYDEAPLSSTLTDLGRYFKTPIIIEGDVSRLTFSGVLYVQDEEAVLLLLEETLPIKITRSNKAITVTAIN